LQALRSVGGSPFLWELPFLLGRLPKEKVAKGFPLLFPKNSGREGFSGKPTPSPSGEGGR